MLTVGLVVLVAILAGLAKVSSSAGAFALVLLLCLWGVFLLGHASGVSGFFGRFSTSAAPSAPAYTTATN
jgi:hypothetical protein